MSPSPKPSSTPRGALVCLALLASSPAGSAATLHRFPEGPAYVDSDAGRLALGDERIAWGAGALLSADHSLEDPGALIPPSEIRALEWYGDRLLALTRVHGLLVISVDEGALSVAAELPLPDIHELVDMSVVSQTVFVTGWRSLNHRIDQDGYLFEIDLSDPLAPHLMSTTTLPGSNLGKCVASSADEIYASGGRNVYQASRDSLGGFELSAIATDSDGVLDLALGWDGLFVAWDSGRIALFETMGPDPPEPRASIAEKRASSIDVHANLPLLVALTKYPDSKLEAFDVSNLAAPRSVWSEAVGGRPGALDVGEEVLGHTDQSGSLRLLRRLGGGAEEVATLAGDHRIEDFHTAAGHAFADLSVYRGGTRVVRVSRGREVSAVPVTANETSRVTALSGSAHSGTWSSGLRIWEIPPEGTPTHAATIDSGALFWETLVDGEVAVNAGRVLDLRARARITSDLLIPRNLTRPQFVDQAQIGIREDGLGGGELAAEMANCVLGSAVGEAV